MIHTLTHRTGRSELPSATVWDESGSTYIGATSDGVSRTTIKLTHGKMSIGALASIQLQLYFWYR